MAVEVAEASEIGVLDESMLAVVPVDSGIEVDTVDPAVADAYAELACEAADSDADDAADN